jgi:3-oxoacyl-[acyl-carrier-protein] synthase-3
MPFLRSIIKSTGHYLPAKIVTNDDLAKIVDTSDEWITKRTGIKSRHIAEDEQTTGDLAIKAAREALARGHVKPDEIDGVIVATTTPDLTFPSVAVKVQAALDIPPGMAFDLQAVCSGFIYALATADSLIKCKKNKRILVIGAEKMSSVIDWADRTTCVLFADGAGAVIVEADENSQNTLNDRGIVSTHLYADGRQAGILHTTGGTSTNGQAGTIKMEGREVFKHAVTLMANVVDETLTANNLSGTDIDWLVPHQANIRIIERTAKKLNLPMEKVITTLDHHGNTSAASIPLALHEAVADGRIKPGDLLLMEALGAGLTWGAALVRF